MVLNIKFILAILVASQACIMLCKCDLLLIYAEQEKIHIRKATTAEVVKEISISEYSRTYMAHHYKQDLIFYAYDKKLYRIHLVDDNGDRKISGSGDLFVDKNADHMEILISDGQMSGFSGLHVDESNNKLYVLTYRELIELDLEGKNARTVYKQSPTMSGLFYHDEMLYLATESPKTSWKDKDRSTIGRYNMKTGAFEVLVQPSAGDIFDLTVDRKYNKLLYRQGSAIKVIDTNGSSYPITNARVVLSDSQFTGGSGLQAITADSRVIIWLSSDQLYAGYINANYNFISKKHIFAYGRKGYSFRPYNLRMFHHNFKSPSKPLPPSYNCIALNN